MWADFMQNRGKGLRTHRIHLVPSTRLGGKLMVKKCLRCNADNDDNAIFCSSCGTRLSGVRPGILGARPVTAELAARASIGFVMTIIGGFLIVLGSLGLSYISAYIWGTSVPPWFAGMPVWAALGVGVIFGLFVILSSVLIYQPGFESMGGILAIVFSVLSIVVLGGFMFGTVLGLLGGLMAILKK